MNHVLSTRRYSLLLTVPFWLLALPLVAEDAKPAGFDDAVLGEIPVKMKGFVDAQQMSGSVTLVGRQGKIVHLEAVGLADIEAKRPMTKDTLFGIASMTKPITATALMILVDEKKVSLDDPVSKYVSEFKEAALA